ncbi:hypothetical protein EVAR_36204_1 [Eumeta japonica]|uniref:Uncharacterized protein n=1 Tax=Eumeta variegata TaxID=151549 RepID=A0A4C1VQR9_EUMVA|nr:hypothetical protein EVAR_36204_1 [Eumeta japonica]
MQQPHKKKHTSIANFTDICLKNAFTERAALSDWATTALPRAHVAHEHQKGKLFPKIIILKNSLACSSRAVLSARARVFLKFFGDDGDDVDGKMTAGPSKDPPKNVPNDTYTEDIIVLFSVIISIDISELGFHAKKFKAAANPVEKIIVLAKHPSLVESINNNKI